MIPRAARGAAMAALLLLPTCDETPGGEPIGNRTSADVADNAGPISFVGRQDAVFETGRAAGTIRLADLAGIPNLYALGAAADLDGEVTILNSQPFTSRVRGANGEYVVSDTLEGMAIFLAWAELADFREVPVPSSVADYAALGQFIRTTADEHGLDADMPVAFLLRGVPAEMVWHINVDRTDGQPIDRELFRKSKEFYELQGEEIEAFGVYSEHHGGVFMTPGSTLHMHFASHDSQATGHIDAIVPGDGLTLLLPTNPGS